MAESACKLLEARGHSVTRLRDVIPTDSPDPMVAKVSQDHDAILISHDGDYKKIAPRIAKGARRRFRKLSRVHLDLEHARASDRLAAAIMLIEFEWAAAASRPDKRLHISIGLSVIRTHR